MSARLPNSDNIVMSLDVAEETERVIQAAGEIKRTGATGAYTQEFERMEKQLNDVSQLLQNTTQSNVDIRHIDAQVESLRSVSSRSYLIEIVLNQFNLVETVSLNLLIEVHYKKNSPRKLISN